MVVSLWIGTTGRLDKVPAVDVLRFEHEFLDYLRRQNADLLGGIRETTKFEEGDAKALEEAYEKFTDQFETSDGGSIKVGHEPEAEALGDEELEQEQIVKQKRG
jgi:F-type H+-transporting ATPase subunit alpha